MASGVIPMPKTAKQVMDVKNTPGRLYEITLTRKLNRRSAATVRRPKTSVDQHHLNFGCAGSVECHLERGL